MGGVGNEKQSTSPQSSLGETPGSGLLWRSSGLGAAWHEGDCKVKLWKGFFKLPGKSALSGRELLMALVAPFYFSESWS